MAPGHKSHFPSVRLLIKWDLCHATEWKCRVSCNIYIPFLPLHLKQLHLRCVDNMHNINFRNCETMPRSGTMIRNEYVGNAIETVSGIRLENGQVSFFVFIALQVFCFHRYFLKTFLFWHNQVQVELEWNGFATTECQWIPATQEHCQILIPLHLHNRIITANSRMQMLLDIFRSNGMQPPRLLFPQPPRYETLRTTNPNQLFNHPVEDRDVWYEVSSVTGLRRTQNGTVNR